MEQYIFTATFYPTILQKRRCPSAVRGNSNPQNLMFVCADSRNYLHAPRGFCHLLRVQCRGNLIKFPPQNIWPNVSFRHPRRGWGDDDKMNVDAHENGLGSEGSVHFEPEAAPAPRLVGVWARNPDRLRLTSKPPSHPRHLMFFHASHGYSLEQSDGL